MTDELDAELAAWAESDAPVTCLLYTSDAADE